MTILSADVMKEVSRLTRSGNASAATALIQSTLAGSSAVGGTAGATHRHRTTPHAEASAPAESRAQVRILNPDVRSASASLIHDSKPEVKVTDANSNGRPEAAPTGDFIDGSYRGADGELHYKLYKPALATNESAPLLVMLHGCTQDAGDFAAGTAMNAIAQAKGLYVLYPTQSSKSNMNRCWNWFERAHQHRGSGEPGLLSALTKQVIEAHAIDASRVYIAGLSAGGAMALIMAEQYPELFAAVGVHSGLPTGAATSVSEAFGAMQGKPASGTASSATRMPGGWSSRLPTARSPFQGFSPVDGQTTAAVREHGSPIPTIVFHGAKDKTVNPANGERIVSDWLARTSDEADGPNWQATTDSAVMATGYRYSVTTYSRDSAEQSVGCELWSLASCAHCWSGGDASGSYTDANGPDASAEMVRFFLDRSSH